MPPIRPENVSCTTRCVLSLSKVTSAEPVAGEPLGGVSLEPSIVAEKMRSACAAGAPARSADATMRRQQRRFIPFLPSFGLSYFAKLFCSIVPERLNASTHGFARCRMMRMAHSQDARVLRRSGKISVAACSFVVAPGSAHTASSARAARLAAPGRAGRAAAPGRTDIAHRQTCRGCRRSGHWITSSVRLRDIRAPRRAVAA